ncbi:MAG TPA: BadF/BadG/BcrA/BcrD ATPase family protein [Blastocatellia bacterium]|nr:BadF/BadG/BcrA/BcrD ATPase family protein [Blastocatellia bacterium]HMX30096.1 BadF/BadG/BcrA/BcrD ATPase family protein [Blastocatellia bacterium]HMY73000.1 BadF/BadG/BcrA/BcrD ATPase family protein [Blastocatellia bacterium]HMZ18777.1 BadF/BadG/BcrA/BcrD ATPase family protein [Blastocatellia bacterium]HNG29606.1 BadF/BadG/BcrA/BcrD ATPase family protein [Blastocatellia bacterium]
MNTVTFNAASTFVFPMILDDAHPQTPTQFWLGIDGGGTNCRATVIGPDGELLGEGHAEAANLIRVGLDNAVANVKKAVHQACERAGIEPAQITAACIGLAGVSQPRYHRQMLDALKRVLPIPEISLETDARVALAGATGNRPGVVIIAGTGSIACGVNARGHFARSGGWGPIMGDEGSGSYIGRRTLEAVMMAWDYRGKPTGMMEPVLKHFGVSSPPELTTVIYDSSPKEKGEIQSRIAQLSRVAVSAAQEGDAVAQDILSDAARELAKTAIAVIEQLRMEQDAFRVAYVGGVFEAGELILKPLREEIQKVAPNAEIAPPLESPVIGAVKMAQARRA